MFKLGRQGDVHILTLQNGENLMDRGFFRELDHVLDEVEAASRGDAALVVTGEGKYFSNGLDLPVITGYGPEEATAFGLELMRGMGRLLVFPIPTVAAVNGHAFAGGALLAASCDYRVMREDRGWLCMAEVDVGVPIDPELMALLAAKLPPATLRTSVLEGHRYPGTEALAAGWVDALAPEDELLSAAVERAAGLASKGRDIFAAIKRGLWGEIAKGLGYDADPPAT